MSMTIFLEILLRSEIEYINKKSKNHFDIFKKKGRVEF